MDLPTEGLCEKCREISGMLIYIDGIWICEKCLYDHDFPKGDDLGGIQFLVLYSKFYLPKKISKKHFFKASIEEK